MAIKQIVLTRIHKALGWIMLLVMPLQVLSGAMSGDRPLLLAVHLWLSWPLALMIVSHGLLGIRFTVLKRLGNAGGWLLAALWLLGCGGASHLILRTLLGNNSP